MALCRTLRCSTCNLYRIYRPCPYPCARRLRSDCADYCLYYHYEGVCGQRFGHGADSKKDADDLDFSSVFYFNFVVCLVLYAIMFMAAPIIANFYKDISLTPIIRVISLTIVISGVKGIQQSYVLRNILFKRFLRKARWNDFFYVSWHWFGLRGFWCVGDCGLAAIQYSH